MNQPILYSLQNCPYAMRARLALLSTRQTVVIRAVNMLHKPEAMLAASPKGTVPVLIIPPSAQTDTCTVIDESLDIMRWALSVQAAPQGKPQQISQQDSSQHTAQLASTEMQVFINQHEMRFIPELSRYKYAVRYHQADKLSQRQRCEVFISEVEQRLSQHDQLMDTAPSIADYAILPFMRQFGRVERQWFLHAPYPHLRRWLNGYLQSQLFAQAMRKYPYWQPEQNPQRL